VKDITTSDISNSSYPKNTARQRNIGEPTTSRKVALCGDSTIDNGFWVNESQKYNTKPDTVAYQTAQALAEKENSNTYALANFAIDGATTTTMLKAQTFCEVIPEDEDHPNQKVKQLDEIKKWSPDIAVLSVGGNNFRLTLQDKLMDILNPSDSIFSNFSILCRFTTNDVYKREQVKVLFENTQRRLYHEYKQIIDGLVENGTTKRLVISSQYYPALTPFTKYFIYTGFSHLAHVKNDDNRFNNKYHGAVDNINLSAFQVADDIMHKLYKEVLTYAAEKNIEVVFADVTSSMSPLNGNLTAQIEPNGKGAKCIGQLMAEAIELEIPDDKKNTIPVIRLNQEQQPEIQYLEKTNIKDLKLKNIDDFIQQDRYAHIKLLFAKESSIFERFVYFYELLAGKQFDNEYQGLFAFGLLDLSIVTIAASYLWRVALNENMNILVRMTSGLISGPILMIKHTIALIALAAIALVTFFIRCIFNLGLSLTHNISQCFQAEPNAVATMQA
jgi:hypothetical protein